MLIAHLLERFVLSASLVLSDIRSSRQCPPYTVVCVLANFSFLTFSYGRSLISTTTPLEYRYVISKHTTGTNTPASSLSRGAIVPTIRPVGYK
jgi:hypothetical protein